MCHLLLLLRVFQILNYLKMYVLSTSMVPCDWFLAAAGPWRAVPHPACCSCAFLGLGGTRPCGCVVLPALTVISFCLSFCLFSDGPICRICHEGGNGEGLLSPCDCTGTLGTVHKSCLEKWLSSSNTSYCELCHTEFVVERRPRPLTEVPFSSCFIFISISFERK